MLVYQRLLANGMFVCTLIAFWLWKRNAVAPCEVHVRIRAWSYGVSSGSADQPLGEHISVPMFGCSQKER
jgi:hypothetical protein